MYLVVDKKTKDILHMSNSLPGEDKKPRDVFPSFDPATMEFGRAPEQYIPVRFAIEKGVVKDLDAAPAERAETIAQARERVVRALTDAAVSSRRMLIPDYQLMNAGLGLYDEDRVQAIRDTVQAFRDEVNRLEKLTAKAKSVKELGAITPSFPTAIARPKAKPAPKAK
jgi:hypothetical protein